MGDKKLRKLRRTIVLTFIPSYIIGYFSYRKFTTLKEPYQNNYTKYFVDTATELWKTGRCNKDTYFRIEPFKPKLK